MALSDSIAGLAGPCEAKFWSAYCAINGGQLGEVSAGLLFQNFGDCLAIGAWTSAAELLLPEGWRVMPAVQYRDGSWQVSLINDERDGVVTGKGAALACAMVVAALKVRGL